MNSEHFEHRSQLPHRVAIALACVTFPLIWVGGLVTTYDAGMAVPDWPTTYGYNMFLYPLSTWLSGPWDLFIEHGHRLLGSLVGLITIGLVLAIWFRDERKWVRWVAIAALALVIFQGVLGGMRVRMVSTDLARIHGCTGPLFFALVVLLCVITSQFWRAARSETTVNEGLQAKALANGWFLFVLAYLQLVIGAHLRHPNVTWHPGVFRSLVVMHLVVAAFLLIQAATIAWRSRQLGAKQLTRPAQLIPALVTAQVLLGILTWRAKYGWPTFLPIPDSWTVARFTLPAESMEQALTVTGHVAVGSLILAASVCYATRLTRCYFLSRGKMAPSASPGSYTSFPRIEGAVS